MEKNITLISISPRYVQHREGLTYPQSPSDQAKMTSGVPNPWLNPNPGGSTGTQVALNNPDSQVLIQRCGVWDSVQVRQKTTPVSGLLPTGTGAGGPAAQGGRRKTKSQHSEAQER